MKKIVLYIGLVAGLFQISCDTKKVDQKIATEINDLKDTLKIETRKDTIFIAENQFEKTALEKQMKSLKGQSIRFDSILNLHKGKTIVLDIWASWCPDCIKGFPGLKKVQTQYPNVAYVFISLDKTEEAWKKAVEKFDLKGDHYYLNEKMKGEFGTSIHLDWIPRYMIIDQEGTVANYKSIVTTDTLFLKTLEHLEKNSI